MDVSLLTICSSYPFWKWNTEWRRFSSENIDVWDFEIQNYKLIKFDLCICSTIFRISVSVLINNMDKAFEKVELDFILTTEIHRWSVNLTHYSTPKNITKCQLSIKFLLFRLFQNLKQNQNQTIFFEGHHYIELDAMFFQQIQERHHLIYWSQKVLAPIRLWTFSGLL